MSNKDKISNEELKKLEDAAYFELCQIIAEAMEFQDVELLDARIAYWKNKYKKLLDMPSTNSKSDFKKRIEFLLNQYYSSVTQYILNQLKLKEQKKIEHQAKALRELYVLIRDTNDLPLLKKKVDKWKEKYPVSSFISMYQKRISSYTRQKNLEENAFEQEKAFAELVDITKINGTLDELKGELDDWEKEYSINNKYTIDDFIKHQSEIKRYTSYEFLQSIARKEDNPDNIDKSEIDIVNADNNKSNSSLSVQENAYASLIAISKSHNSIDEMFKWVYRNNGIKFNDKYKELILSATHLEYSPTYLNKLEKPNLDVSKKSLSFDEYQNIDSIKRYAVISYFNLLLPPDKAISNDYFNKNIGIIYSKSEAAKATKSINNNSDSIEDFISSGIEIPLKETKIANPKTVEKADVYVASENEPVIEFPSKENNEANLESIFNQKDDKIITDPIFDNKTLKVSKPKFSSLETIDESNSSQKQENVEPLDYTTVVALSPLFFEQIYSYTRQASAVNIIDNTTSKYIEHENSQEFSIDNPIKIKNDVE